MSRILLVTLLSALVYTPLQREGPVLIGKVEGIVRRGSARTAVTGMSVQLRHRLGVINTLTDASGRFVFTNIPPGEVDVMTVPNGIIPDERSSRQLSLRPGEEISDLQIVLYEGGTVSGRVALPNGQPAVGASVAAVTRNYQIDGRCVFENAATVRTNDNGAFRIFGLKPGEYFVRAQNLTAAGQQGGTARSYTYFSQALDPARAQSILILDEQEKDRIDLILSRSIETKLSGKIEADLPVDASTEIRVRLRNLDGCDHDTNSAARIVGTGFEGITSAPPGAYEVIASVASRVDTGNPITSLGLTLLSLGRGRTTSGRTEVQIAGSSVEGIVLRVYTLLPLVGRVVVADGSSAIRFDTLGVLLAYPDDTGVAAVTVARGLVSRASVKSDGQFAVPTSSDGKHFLFIEGLPDDVYVSDIVRDKRSIHEDGVEIGSSRAPVEVVIDSRGGRISGVAEDRLGNRLPSVRAVLIPKTHRKNLLLYKTTITDAQGGFVFRAVAPGEYQLLAFDEIPENAWLNPEYLAPYEERAVALHVDVAENLTNIRLRNISSGQ